MTASTEALPEAIELCVLKNKPPEKKKWVSASSSPPLST